MRSYPCEKGTALAGLALCSLLLSGCASLRLGHSSNGWLADYDVAEARMQRDRLPLFIYYNDFETGPPDTTTTALESPALELGLEKYVRCRLFRDHEPDRRYVAQFGVERTPALIVLHRDGTYHARTGPMDAGEIASFLDEAQPPGAVPDWAAHVPRRPQYNWVESLAEADASMRRTARPALVVFYRRAAGDWRKIRRLLHTHEVASRARHMIHCRVGLWKLFDDTYISPFGPVTLPAIAVVQPDGTYDVYELPASSEALARFIDRARRPAEPSHDEAAAGTR